MTSKNNKQLREMQKLKTAISEKIIDHIADSQDMTAEETTVKIKLCADNAEVNWLK